MFTQDLKVQAKTTVPLSTLDTVDKLYLWISWKATWNWRWNPYTDISTDVTISARLRLDLCRRVDYDRPISMAGRLFFRSLLLPATLFAMHRSPEKSANLVTFCGIFKRMYVSGHISLRGKQTHIWATANKRGTRAYRLPDNFHDKAQHATPGLIQDTRNGHFSEGLILARERL
ncbi:uncharacterized protein ARMOST_15428 [Armillaria ostoyae]|uniref:Uncharacterized protein n=1 Tax=Armillaria ostoyae TaxID=47428 RepID=A0A284RTF1_ARMOS|nr:uncharacterized protein ARMOST_15428 [Armillaria ostoyae]